MTHRFARQIPKGYAPPKRDSRVEEARVCLQMRHRLEGLPVSTFAATFTLKPETAERLFAEERARRG